MTISTFLVSAYCACILCTGHTHGITKSQHRVQVKHTIACPKAMLGKVVWLYGLGPRVCDDIGSAIQGRRIDLYMETHEEALDFGKKLMKVRIF